jgi:acetyltransferase-like isoleucine patch superfamily enzyme
MDISIFLEKHETIKKVVVCVFRYLSGLKFLILLITGHIPSHFIRCFIYRIFGLTIGNNSHIYGRAEIRSPHLVTIRKNSMIGHDAILDGRGGLDIGNNVNISSGVWIWTAEHDPYDADFRTKTEPVVIEDYSWLSCRSVILPGVRVGYGSVGCAGAVVTKNTEPYSIVAGVPAKKIGERIKEPHYSLGEPTPFI